MRKRILTAFVCMACAAGAAPAVQRDFWSFDAVEWGDGRGYAEPVRKEGPFPHGFKADYRVSVPETGWYELLLAGANGMVHDLFVDGRAVYRFAAPSADDAAGKDLQKAANLFLSAGPHTIRIQRVGRPSFPIRIFSGLELRPGDGTAARSISAAKAGLDVVRTGENVRVRILAGGAKTPLRYEILSRDLLDADRPPAVVAAVEFPAGGAPQEKTVAVPCPAEGVFQLAARAGGALLKPAEFRVGEYAVVDVRTAPSGGGEPVPVHDIDCVAQTDMGAPIAPGTFFECNGATRISRTAAGRYRESNDCTGPEVEVPKSPTAYPRSYSGFSYELRLPDEKAAYLLEIEYPDDDRRSVTVPVTYLADATGEMLSGAYSGKSWETGGIFPLTGTMLVHRAVFWASSRRVNIGLLSQQIGQRAAAARIRVLRFPGDLPLPPAPPPGGRTFAHWYEEGENWKYVVNGLALGKGKPPVVGDWLGLRRWVQLARWAGMNGISGVGVGYQGAFYRTDVLEGYMPCTYDMARLAALLCEKYRMKFIPEVFPGQWYINLMVMDKQVGNPDELRPFSCHGIRQGPPSAAVSRNALHPLVQETWIRAAGELADKLRDSPAFAGLTVRADGWLFDGQFTLASLYWGYSDWTIAEFSRETGIAVPGAPGDPGRFMERYSFLTGPSMRDRWIAWRCGRILDYHRRIRDRIRGGRKDVFFGIVGDGRCDPSYAPPDDPRERFLGIGVDTARLAGEDGIAVIPTARYGARDTTSLEQSIYDDFLNPAYKAAGFGAVRGMAAYMVYHELGENIPYDKLGVAAKKFYYCSSVDGGGRHTLEKFAAALADQDSAILRDGGNSYIFGDPAVWRPWFAEFQAIPAAPFERLAAAVDPVAVWHRALPKTADRPAGLYFYAVNRERYPATVTLKIAGADSVVRAAGGERVALERGRLALHLLPYELRSFRAPAGARIAGARTDVPAERIEYVKERLTAAQRIAGEIAGPRAGDVAPAARAAFRAGLDAAWSAFARGEYWRARTTLSMAPMMRVYEDLGAMPDGQVVTRFPRKLVPKPDRYYALGEPVIGAEELARAAPAGSRAEVRDSRAINPEWGGARVLFAPGGLLEFDLPVPAAGLYTLAVGHVAGAPGVTTVAVNGRSLALPIVTGAPNAPESVSFPRVAAAAGTARVTLRRDGAFGVYGVKWLPALRPLPSETWSVIGPFPSAWGGGPGRLGQTDEGVRAGFARALPAETKPDLAAIYRTGDRELRWRTKTDDVKGRIDDRGVDFVNRAGSPSQDFCLAATFIKSPDERTVELVLATDWWANATLNGERVTSNLTPAVVTATGADFSTMRYHRGLLKLRKGTNILLVKNQGGSLGNSFSAYVSDHDDLRFSPVP